MEKQKIKHAERRWIADFEVFSYISLLEKDKRLKFRHPNDEFEVHIKDFDTRPGMDNPTLSVQILFKCSEDDDIVSIAKNKLDRFLMILSLVSSSKIKINRLKRIIDCTESQDLQRCYQYLRSPDPEIPLRALNEHMLETVGKLMTNSHDKTWWEALKWYSLGIASTYTDEQFQCFWLSLEILAERSKSSEPVADKCQKCLTPLYCKTCKSISKHKPFPKQAIEQIVDKRHKGKGHELMFPMLSDFRNTLFHGSGLKKCENKHNIKFEEAMDALGKLVFAELMSTIKLPGGKYRLAMIESSTFCHKEIIYKADMNIGSSKPINAEPEIEDFANVDVTIEIGEKDKDGSILTKNIIK